MLTFGQLLWRNLCFYRRTNLAVICGVIAATAVISGALIVGDSVRSSLRQISLDRLGKVDHVVSGGRFFREKLAEEIQSVGLGIQTVAPALTLPGTIEFEVKPGEKRRVGQVNVYGGDDRFWGLLDHHDVKLPESGEIVLNQRVADQLGVKVGDTVSLVTELPSAIPRDALLGERNQTVAAQPATVSAIIPEEIPLARLGLNPTQQLPANAYVSLLDLQAQLGLQEVARSRRQAEEKPARVNALFIGMENGNSPAEQSPEKAKEISKALDQKIQLSDLGLRVVKNSEQGYLSLESQQMFLEDGLSGPAEKAVELLKLKSSPVLVSLINEIWKPETPDKYSMYSVVAGVDPKSAPFGPFEMIGESKPLTGNAIYLNEWVAEDLAAKVGDKIALKYHVVGDRGELPEETQEFVVAGIVKLTGPANDRGYTPHVPGVTDAQSYADWNEPFPLKKDRITDRDDDYWEEYRTTPKLFVSLEAAQSFWKSRYGSLTSLRIAPTAGQSLDQLEQQFVPEFLKQIDPQQLGFAVQPVKYQGLMAANGTTDFTGLFIGFSFFLIVSAAILTGLLFRLGIERRLSEVGLLQAIGLSPRFIRRLLLCEGLVLVGLGTLIGSAAAVAYAGFMILGLKTWWIGAIGTRFLFLDVQPQSLLIGAVIAGVVALLAVWWAQRQAEHQSPRALLTGSLGEQITGKKSRLAPLLASMGLGGAGILLVAALTGLIPDVEAFAGFSWRIVVFFLVGIGLLVGGLAAFSLILGGRDRASTPQLPQISTAKLAVRNAARNRSRSVLTASLIASATFVIVAVAAGQMNPTGAAPNPRSGNGGFTLVAETSVPVLYDFNTVEGQNKLGFNLQDAATKELLAKSRFAAFRMNPGENASCLNLYQTQLPTCLGVPDDVLDMLIKEDRFVFADTRVPQPWALLREELPEGRIPVLGDMNTLMYSLHKGIGQTIPLSADDPTAPQMQVVGMFANSIFQGVLVMSESNFRKLFPDRVGFQYFLIEVDPKEATALSTLLESQLGDYGFDSDRVANRLADFLAVQNTYLSTFQTLGGLGLLLGTLGLATVMLRNVLERAKEFSLLQAVGLRKSQIAKLVAWENAFLLGGGLLAGTASALLAMAPHLLSAVADIPWWNLVVMLIAIFVVGMLAAMIAVRAAVKLPILATLHGD
ncbi:FtsX-like permease family protein [Planctomicrobium sp. SH527]|uniref:FtsX-like permease family protein n=1 Tax=Planctomicrobium sp. SH527 TaxID=3448123 RepID=UPI003F5B0D6E